MTPVIILVTAVISAALTYLILKKLDLIKKEDGRICNDYSTYNPSTLTTGLIGDMVSIYRKRQLKTINTNLATNDAHAIWFDLETLKKFIYHIEKGVKMNGFRTTGTLGLRFYYAAYPKKPTWKEGKYNELRGFLGNPITEQYEDKHTLVMVPTATIDGKNTDFNPFDASTYANGLPVYKKPMSDDEDAVDEADAAMVKVMALTASTEDTVPPTSASSSFYGSTMAQNHGSLYPPDNIDGTSF